MRTAGIARVGAMAAVTGAALVITTPPASAVEGGQVIVSPSNARPGQAVRITATGCITTSSTTSSTAVSRAYSNAFPTISLQAYKGGTPGAVTGTGTVFSSVKPGTYKVNVACDVNSGVSATATLTVMRSGSSPGPSASASAMPMPTTKPAAPRGSARTGLGGGITHPDGGEVAFGTALMAGALATGFVIRRRAGRKG
ncbi:hypothetical protein NGB36_15895 [Streptomyces sp. RB6PN25]|uniref:Gram-positive cocci surface proteins LPxTG domain-containing protein n=1 Tax=Streptomyces humicola TaxID=2953240 RepID=A0ABT1PWJ8_9ACTN|nr:hypothetical protein [Streptomyces humicola]MCQ4082048.1 hypothetical protein [Streptomyces humicola]